MIALTHRVTGHQIKVDDESAAFWQAAGYREDKATDKVPAKKSASRKSSTKK